MSLARNWVNMTSEQYHAAPGLSSSALRCFILEGELAYYHRYVARTQVQPETDALKLGRIFHLAMEKPTTWEQEVVVISPTVPDPLDPLAIGINSNLKAGSKADLLYPGAEWNERLKTHRQYRDDVERLAQAQGKHFLRHEEYEQVKSQVNAVWDNHSAKEILTGNQLKSEMACFATAKTLPFQLKALLDNHDDDCVIDFKSTRFLNWSDFIRDGYRKGYHWQMAYYCLVSGLKRAKIIAVTNTPPYEANVFYMGPKRIKQLINGLKSDGSDGLIYQIKKLSGIYDHLQLQHNLTLDSLGVPLEWHHERWGKPIPFATEAAAGAEVEEDSEEET
jgi:hypothetical protein